MKRKKEVLEIKDVSVALGTKKFDYLMVEEATTLRTFQYNTIIGPPRQRAVMIPLMTINGSSPGPTLCITAGVHGCEYTGIEASIRTYNQIDPGDLKGSLLIVPVVNPASFWTMTPYVNIQDGVDISDAYGTEGQTVSYFIAKTLLENVLSKADLIVDFHAGDLLEELLPHSGFTKTGNEKVDSKSEMFSRVFGLETISETVASERVGKLALDIPQIFVEVGCCGKLEERFVTLAMTGISNLMKKMGMMEGEPVLPQKQIVWHSKALIYTKSRGIFQSKVQVGDEVKERQIIGEIKNLQGHVEEKILAPYEGVVYLKMYNPVKHPGDLLFKCFIG